MSLSVELFPRAWLEEALVPSLSPLEVVFRCSLDPHGRPTGREFLYRYLHVASQGYRSAPKPTMEWTKVTNPCAK